MKLKIKEGRLTFRSAYKLAVVGWMCGFGLLMSAVFVLIAPIVLLTDSPVYMNGELVSEQNARNWIVLLGVVLTPVIVFFQSFFFAVPIAAGIMIYQRLRGPIVIATEE